MTRVQYRKFQAFMKLYLIASIGLMLSVIVHHIITRA